MTHGKDPTLRYASGITGQKKCWELLAEKFDQFQTSCYTQQGVQTEVASVFKGLMTFIKLSQILNTHNQPLLSSPEFSPPDPELHLLFDGTVTRQKPGHL